MTRQTPATTKSQVTIYCSERYPNGGKSLIGKFFYLHKLSEVPGWLQDIEAHAARVADEKE